MHNESLNVRTDFVKQLLCDLNKAHTELEKVSYDLEALSSDHYEKVFNKYLHEINAEIFKYNENLKMIKELHSKLTQSINNWFQFCKSPDALGKPTYPIKHYLHKKMLKKKIAKTNNTISNIIIENRFIKEQLLIWEQELEFKALKEFKVISEYENYENLLTERNRILEDLKYLLPTIQEILPVVFDVSKPNNLIELLS